MTAPMAVDLEFPFSHTVKFDAYIAHRRPSARNGQQTKAHRHIGTSVRVFGEKRPARFMKPTSRRLVDTDKQASVFVSGSSHFWAFHSRDATPKRQFSV